MLAINVRKVTDSNYIGPMIRRAWIVSRLKPANDVRMAQKLAISLEEIGFDEICITGKPFVSLPHQMGNIYFAPYECQKPEDGRKWAQISELYKKALKLKPQIIVACSPDLLPLAVTHKILFGSKLYYDIQEDYLANLSYMKTKGFLLGRFLGYLIRLTEWFCSPFVDGFFLAERKYVQKLGFIGNRYLILENKAVSPDANNLNGLTNDKTANPLPVVFLGGTLSEEFGVTDLLTWAKEQNATLPCYELRLFGHCPSQVIRNKLNEAQKLHPWLRGKWTAYPLAFEEITKEGQNCDFYALPYRQNEAIKGKVPTKLYQCLYEQRRVLHHCLAFSNIANSFAKENAKATWSGSSILKLMLKNC